MKEFFRSIKNESGSVTVIGLILIFLFFVVMVWVTRITLNVDAADADLKNAVAVAAKAAAYQIDPEAQANGDPRIAPDRANEAFRHILAQNMGLDSNTLEPKETSTWSEKPDYMLLVYNSSNPYGLTNGTKFIYEDDNEYIEDITDEGFPMTFNVSDGAIKVELPSPGVIAVVRAKPHDILGKSMDYIRWASARVVTE